MRTKDGDVDVLEAEEKRKAAESVGQTEERAPMYNPHAYVRLDNVAQVRFARLMEVVNAEETEEGDRRMFWGN